MTGIMTQIFYLFPDASSYDVILFLNLVQNGHNRVRRSSACLRRLLERNGSMDD